MPSALPPSVCHRLSSRKPSLLTAPHQAPTTRIPHWNCSSGAIFVPSFQLELIASRQMLGPPTAKNWSPNNVCGRKLSTAVLSNLPCSTRVTEHSFFVRPQKSGNWSLSWTRAPSATRTLFSSSRGTGPSATRSKCGTTETVFFFLVGRPHLQPRRIRVP